MKKRIIVCIVVLLLIAIIIGIISIKNNNKENSGNISVKMNEVTRSVFYAPQYAAINNGYFKDYGIDIDLITGQRS